MDQKFIVVGRRRSPGTDKHAPYPDISVQIVEDVGL